jgi:DNA-binding XRE family transcriptional regulator
MHDTGLALTPGLCPSCRRMPRLLTRTTGWSSEPMATIRQLREHQGWSQYELALRVGVHPQAVYLWEHGRRTPKVVQMRTLGTVFGLCSDVIDLEPRYSGHPPDQAD